MNRFGNALVAFAVLTLAGCGGSTSPTTGASVSTLGPVPGSSGTQEMIKPELVGTPTLLQAPYGLPNEIGFDVAVVFELRNPSSKPLPEARSVVSVRDAKGTLMGRSDPQNVSLAAGETRLIVVRTDVSVPGDTNNAADVSSKAPVNAEVTTYASLPGLDTVNPTGRWTAEKLEVNCSTGTIACEITGDLTWTGAQVASAPQLTAVVREKGKLILAGVSTANGTFPPGAAQPIKLSVVGNKDLHGNYPPLTRPDIELIASGS